VDGMEKLKETNLQYPKINLYIDIDNTILNTAEAFIEKYCKENNIEKDFYDLKDWGFKSIDRNINIHKFLKYIEEEEFFNDVKYYDEFLRFYVKHADDFIFNFITIGTKKNLEMKKHFLLRTLPTLKNVNYIGFEKEKSKDNIDMSNGIQIDDKYENLNTNAKIKILQKNYIDTDYNKVNDIREDLYIMQNWKQIGESIEFIDKHRDIYFKDNNNDISEFCESLDIISEDKENSYVNINELSI
jgi:hypothetical protein